jgi:hypothetical protein
MNGVDPDFLTPHERLDELCDLLAAGIQRMRQKQRKTENIVLDNKSDKSVHVMNPNRERRMT